MNIHISRPMHEVIGSRPGRLRLIANSVLVAMLLMGTFAIARRRVPDVALPRGADRTIDLSTFSGQTYLQAMQAPGNGIFDKTQVDDAAAVTIAGADQVINDINQFDPKVSTRLTGMFKNGQSDLQSLLSKIQGKSFSPQNIRAGLRPFVSQANLTTSASPTIATDVVADMTLLASGSGTLVQIAPGNYFYNVGYQKPVVQSGRSFGAAPGRALLDSSDRDYLEEMGQFLNPGTTPDTTRFYGAILKVLTNCNPSDIPSLPPSGQVVSTDFLTIYTAELIRHAMVNLAPAQHPWEMDLAEVTFLTAYGAPSGMVMKNGSLVPGTAADYFAKGTKGSGIGETRADFMKLSARIVAFENDPKHHPELVNAIANLTPLHDKQMLRVVNGDVLRRFLVYLNRPEFQNDVQNHSTDLVNAMVAFLKQIGADNAEITQFVQSHP